MRRGESWVDWGIFSVDRASRKAGSSSRSGPGFQSAGDRGWHFECKFRGEGACWWLVGISDSSGVEIRRTISAAGPGSEGSAIEKEGETLSEGAVPLCRRGRGTQVVHGLHTDARPGG